MSEYQYYEWQAVDRPLTPAQQAEVNNLSTHIAVTATRAWVDYHWGAGFRHDPLDVLARYFDAFMSYANLGEQQLAFRFPAGLLDENELAPYLSFGPTLSRRDESLVLNITLPDRYDDASFEDRIDLIDFLPLREDILHGDYRSLYLAWLLAAPGDEKREAELEPPVPAGLRELSPALLAFGRFFRLDEALIEAAAEASPALQTSVTVPLEQAIGRLTAEERDAFLLRLAQDEPHLSLILNRRLQQLTRTPHQPAASPRRTWSELARSAR